MKENNKKTNAASKIYFLLLAIFASIGNISAQEFKVDTINSVVDTVSYLRIVTNDKYFPKKEIQIPMYLVADIRFIHRDKLPTPETDTLSVADFHMESKTLWSGMNVGAKRSWESIALQMGRHHTDDGRPTSHHQETTAGPQPRAGYRNDMDVRRENLQRQAYHSR